MKILPVQQGTEAWHKARAGIPTASQFHRIITPTGKPSAQAEDYMHALVAERMLGAPVDMGETPWMSRGSALEAEAAAYFEMQTDLKTAPGGFCLRDDGSAGCSPDRLVGDRGGLEIKCPSAAVHVGYLLGASTAKYKPQVQGSLWVTGLPHWWFLSYCPGLPHVLVEFERDEEYIATIAQEVERLSEQVAGSHEKLTASV